MDIIRRRDKQENDAIPQVEISTNEVHAYTAPS